MMLAFEEEHPFALAYRLVEEGRIDPWNVDIVELANAYLEEIRKIQVLDMRIPARALMAASFLLKKKVEVLFPEPKKAREKKKSYTLEEIVQEFEEKKESFLELPQQVEREEIKERRSVKRQAKNRQKKVSIIPIHISKFEEVLEDIHRLMSQGVKRFSLFELFLGKNLAPYIMALMTLYNDEKIELYQDEPYGDLIVEVVSGE
ncbi:segregation/condensation protein A [Hydrogenobacter hydrogenophilus]|uniref:Segregation and condensation protein A n=1 Tax=Hydrogenobacter hydrogenophilus TaxID=35835 RepID=A0A285NWL1_9AQUI|nr:segregation/condensation protein A [Hydrogenobacter hydrogenophilus]SNZ12021.1 condensin subunit ScpA [Hydrogenobacter hydrogenophilus]